MTTDYQVQCSEELFAQEPRYTPAMLRQLEENLHYEPLDPEYDAYERKQMVINGPKAVEVFFDGTVYGMIIEGAEGINDTLICSPVNADVLCVSQV